MTAGPSILPIRIYYEDTDFSGFVYHARYLHFFERGRTEALRELGIDQSALYVAEGGPFAFVVRRMSIEYHRPARMDDVVSVETRIIELGAATIRMAQAIRRGETLLCEAGVIIAFLGGGKARKLPPDLRGKLASVTNR